MDLLKTSNVNNFCRLCLRGDGEIPVFTKEAETSLSQRIFKCVAVEIFQEDKLPTAVCKLCFNNVNSWYDFKETCDKTQKTLQLWLQYQQSSNLQNEGDKGLKASSSLPAANVTSSSEKTNEATEVSVSSSVECINSAPISALIEIDSEEELNHSPDKNENENSSSSVQQADIPVVSIKIESTHTLSMDAFNNSDGIGNASPEGDGNNLKVSEIDKSTDSKVVGTEEEHANNVEDASCQSNEEIVSGKRKIDHSLSDTEPCSKRTNNFVPSVINSPEDPPNVISIEDPNAIHSCETERCDTISLTDVTADTTTESSQISQGFNHHSIKREAVCYEESEPEIAFVHVGVKSEISTEYLDEGVEEEEEEVQEEDEKEEEEKNCNSSNLQEDSPLEDTLCVTCNRNYTSRGNLVRHMRSKIHRTLSLVKSNKNIVINDEYRTAHSINDDYRTVHPRKCKSIPSYDSDMAKAEDLNFMQEMEEFIATPSVSAKKMKDDVTFDCRICCKSFRSNSERERHFLSIRHQNMAAQQTPLSDDSYLLEKHTPVGRGPQEDDKIYACPVETCDLTFSSGLLLISHMKRHGIISNMSRDLISTNFVNPPPPPLSPSVSTPVIPKHYDCGICGLEFSSPVGKSNHLRSCKAKEVKHRQKKRVTPAVCREEKTDETGNYCPICNLDIADDYTDHFEIHHKGIHQPSTNIKRNPYVKKKVITSKISKAGIHKCKLCSKSFNFMRSLQQHIKQHKLESQINYVCKVCKKVFGNVKSFRIHVRKHFLPKASKKLLCSTCYQAFDNRRDLVRHKSLGKCCPIKLKIYSCNICNHSFNKISSLEEHKTSFHGRDLSPEEDRFSADEENLNEECSIRCNVCHKIYASRSGFRRHLKNHKILRNKERKSIVPLGEFKCDICSTLFPNSSLLEVHQQMCQSNDRFLGTLIETAHLEQLTCKYCDSVFPSQMHLKQHIMSNCPVFVSNCKKCLKCGKYVPEALLNRDWSCKYCSDENPVNKPSNQTVSKPVLYQCPLGKKQFMSRSSMINHYSSCIGNCKNTAAFFCKVCRKKYSDIHRYNEHKRFCQKVITEQLVEGPRLYPCSYCPRSFTRINNRNSHEIKCLRDMKKSINDIDGSVVGASHADDSNLNTSNVDVKVKPVHRCESCSGTFNSPKLLSLHKRKYRKQCGKSNLFKETYSCNFCSNTNLFRYQLHKHTYYCIKKKLKVYPQVVCESCNRDFVPTEGSKEFSLKVQGHILDCIKVPYHPDERPDSNDTTKAYCVKCGFAFVSSESLRIHSATVNCTKIKSSLGIQQNEEVDIKPENPIQMIDSENSKVEDEAEIKSTQPEPVVKVSSPANFSCPYCSKKFQFRKNLIFHKATKHPNGKSRKFLKHKALHCKICNRQFFSAAKLENHEKVHGIVRENVFAEIQEQDEHSKEISPKLECDNPPNPPGECEL